MKKGDIVYRLEDGRRRFYIVVNATRRKETLVKRIATGKILENRMYKMPTHTLVPVFNTHAVITLSHIDALTTGYFPTTMMRPVNNWKELKHHLDMFRGEKDDPIVIKLHYGSFYLYITTTHWGNVIRTVSERNANGVLTNTTLGFKIYNVNPVYLFTWICHNHENKNLGLISS